METKNYTNRINLNQGNDSLIVSVENVKLPMPKMTKESWASGEGGESDNTGEDAG